MSFVALQNELTQTAGLGDVLKGGSDKAKEVVKGSGAEGPVDSRNVKRDADVARSNRQAQPVGDASEDVTKTVQKAVSKAGNKPKLQGGKRNIFGFTSDAADVLGSSPGDAVSNKAAELSDKASSLFGGAAGGASDVAKDAGAKAQDAGEAVSQGTDEAVGKAQETTGDVSELVMLDVNRQVRESA